MKLRFSIYFILAALLILSACQPKTLEFTQEVSRAYPVPTHSTYSPGYPVPENYIEQTAFEAFELAKAEAAKWNSEAVLFGIPATYLMELNLGYPGIGSGWFYMFKVIDQPLEYYIMVDNGQVQGMTEAQPIVVGEPTIKYLPLPSFDEMIDSDEFLKIYDDNGGKEYLAEHPDVVLNPQLYFLEGNQFPIWSMHNAKETGTPNSLFDANALTGEPIPVK